VNESADRRRLVVRVEDLTVATDDIAAIWRAVGV
jgi:hypothetical protein